MIINYVYILYVFYIMDMHIFWSNFLEFNYDLATGSFSTAWRPPWFFSVKNIVTTRSCGAAGSPLSNVKMLTDGFLTSVLPSCKDPAPSVVKKDDELTLCVGCSLPPLSVNFSRRFHPFFNEMINSRESVHALSSENSKKNVK
jgi:hypothetical protein